MAFSPAAAAAAPPVTPETASAAQQSRTRIAQDFDTFLTILTTQLQAQDPLSPMDSNEFTNQLVNFASVEQEIQGNQNLERIGDLLTRDQGLTAVGYLGQEATIAGTTAPLEQGDAGLRFGYELPTSADETRLEIVSATGQVVRRYDGQTAPGRHDLFFDGLDEDGDPVPPGNYTLRVAAVDAQDRTIPADQFITDTVSAVDTSGLEPRLTVGNSAVALTDILAIRQPYAAPTAPQP